MTTVLCDGVDIDCTGIKAEQIANFMAFYGACPNPFGQYTTRLEFTGPVGYDMPTEGVHIFRVMFPGGQKEFRAKADHIPAHKEKASRLVSACPLCESEECCGAVYEDYEYDVPAKTYWNVLEDTEAGK